MLCSFKAPSLVENETTHDTPSMAPKWLYQIDRNGLDVLVDFGVRLRNRNPAAIRALMKSDLTPLYRRSFSRMTKQEVPGLWWSDRPHTVRIPVVRGSRHAPKAWIKDYIAFSDRPTTEKRLKAGLRLIKRIRRNLTSDEGLSVDIPNSLGGELRATMLKPNPKFELVVVNKHDRAALLKLLSEVDTETSVARWLHDRTERAGASLSSALFADYSEWCITHGEVALGRKAFAQALVANGVVKLTRSKEGERYELALRPAPRSAGASRG